MWESSFLPNRPIIIESVKLWLPDITVIGRSYEVGDESVDLVWARSAELQRSGRVSAFARYVDRLYCPFSSYLFPYDVQKCQISFSTMDTRVKLSIDKSAAESLANYTLGSSLDEEEQVSDRRFDTGEWSIPSYSLDLSKHLTNLHEPGTGLSIINYKFDLVRYVTFEFLIREK